MELPYPPLADAFWQDLAQSTWRRKKWRQTDPHPEAMVCCAFGTPIHRAGTYYLRPAYTDGKRWLSQQAYRVMCDKLGKAKTNRYSQAQNKAASPLG